MSCIHTTVIAKASVLCVACMLGAISSGSRVRLDASPTSVATSLLRQDGFFGSKKRVDDSFGSCIVVFQVFGLIREVVVVWWIFVQVDGSVLDAKCMLVSNDTIEVIKAHAPTPHTSIIGKSNPIREHVFDFQNISVQLIEMSVEHSSPLLRRHVL